MKGHFLRALSLILGAATLVGTFAACGQAAAETPSDTTAAETAAETTTDTTGPVPDLPADLDYQGQSVNIWYFTKNSDASEHFLDIQGAQDGDVVNEALFNRNLKVEDTLDCDLVFTDTGVASSDVGSSIRSIIMSGDTTYDIYNVVQWNSAKYVTEGLYLNLANLPYVDIEKPWWSSYYINEINIGKNSRYFLVGDISIDTIRCIACMYFNKNLYTNLFGDADSLYQEVLDGKWTLDDLTAKVLASYSDLNGDNTVNEGDQFGLLSNTYNNIDILYFGAGCHTTSRDADNVPYLDMNNDRTANVMTKIYDLCYNTQGTRLAKDAAGVVQDNLDFNNGYSMFLMGFLYVSEQLRDMTNDYGIIPSPKYDETQETYKAVVHDIATLICLPSNCTKTEICGAVLEDMAYESYKSVTPAYYETAMKTKYTRDALSSQIIDLLHDNFMTDIAYSYNDNFNGLGQIARSMIAGKKSDFASYYAKLEKSAQTKMQKLIDAFQNLNG